MIETRKFNTSSTQIIKLFPWKFAFAVTHSTFIVSSKEKKTNFRLDNILENDEKNGENLGTALEQALKEAVDDETFRKVKRMSYSSNAAEEVSLLE